MQVPIVYNIIQPKDTPNERRLDTEESFRHEFLFIQPRFRRILPARVVEAVAVFAAFFVSEALVGASAAFFLPACAVPRVVAVFLTTVPVLPSLVSLCRLTRRPVRVAGLVAGARDAVGVAAPRRVFAGAGLPAELPLVFDVVVTFLEPAALDDLAFSTKLDSIFVAAAARPAPPIFRGDAGLAIPDLAGEAGRSRFMSRELEDVGDKICAGRTGALSWPWSTRMRFFWPSPASISFSLSAEIASLRFRVRLVLV